MNADDYGLTANVNRGIEEACLAGFVTSTTVLVNGEAAGEVSGLHGVCESISVGVHVNLTLGSPTSAAKRIPTLVGAEGRFHTRPSLVRLLLRRKIAAEEVYREASAQIGELRRLGIEPTHWDTHQHVAELPQIARAVGNAAHDAGIARARTPRVWIASGSGSPFAARWQWRAGNPRRVAGEVARAVSHRVISRHFRTPGFRTAANLVPASAASYAERWNIVLSHLPAGICEITTHPGHVDEHLARLTPGLTTERTVDLDVARSESVRTLLRDNGVVLIPFARL